MYVSGILGILGGVGGRLDDDAVFEEGIENIGEHEDGCRKQQNIRSRQGGETGGNGTAAQSEEDAEAMIHVASVVAKWIEEGGHRIDLS